MKSTKIGVWGIARILAALAFAALSLTGCDNPADSPPTGDSPAILGSPPGGTTTKYTVTFNANGGSGTVPAAQTVNAGSSVTIPSGSGLTKTGYIFVVWNTSDSGTGTDYNAGSSYRVTGNIILYARWQQQSRPSIPTGVTATAASSSSITVRWNSVSGASGYYVYRSSSASGTYTRVGTPSTTSYTNTGLSAGTTYYYKVSAYNNAGESSQSSYASATTIPLTVSGTYSRPYGQGVESYTFNSNGTFTYRDTGDSFSISGTYRISGNSVIITYPSWYSRSDITFTIIDSNTISKYSGLDVYRK